uniref:Bridging integrator 3 n=1 Tax=Anser brachyrhynchus TaxID=132585 RepID=A0A8B9CKE5_9AVES
MLSRAQEAPLQGTELPADPEVVPAVCWIPFKIGQPKKQIVPKTVERDFEREYGKLQQLEDQTKKLQKDMKKSTDADLAMSKSAVKISSDLLSNPLCEQEPGFLEMVTAFDTAMKRMDSFNQEKVRVALGGAGGARGVAPSLPATSSFPLCPHLRGVSPIKLSTHAFSDAGCAGGFSARGKDCSFLVKGHPRCRSSRGRRRANAFPTSLACNHPSCFQQVNQIQKTVIEPLKKFSSVFPSLNMAVKRREQTLQDYKRLQSKVEKYEEKERTGPVLAKLHQVRPRSLGATLATSYVATWEPRAGVKPSQSHAELSVCKIKGNKKSTGSENAGASGRRAEFPSPSAPARAAVRTRAELRAPRLGALATCCKKKKKKIRPGKSQ